MLRTISSSSGVEVADLIATVYHLLGVGEHHTSPDTSGRPMFVRTGKVVSELLA